MRWRLRWQPNGSEHIGSVVSIWSLRVSIDLLKVSEVLATVASVAVGRNQQHYKCGLDLLCVKNGLR